MTCVACGSETLVKTQLTYQPLEIENYMREGLEFKQMFFYGIDFGIVEDDGKGILLRIECICHRQQNVTFILYKLG